MKNNYFFLLLGLFLALTLSSSKKREINTESKMGYYLSYQDYKDKKLQEMDEYFGAAYYGLGESEVGFIFKKGGKKVRVKGDDIWGFTYKKALFRVVPGKGAFARVISTKNIIYYENGHAHSSMLIRNIEKGNFENGDYSYFSNDLNSEMLPWAAPKHKYKAFFMENKKHAKLFNCLEESKRRSFDETRQCAAAYNDTDEMYTE